jgi:hypothetical protein
MYRKMSYRLALATVFFLAYATAQADGMRCGNKLVLPGDSKLEVLSKCGEPDFKETVAIVTHSKEVTLGENMGEKSGGVNLHHRHSSVDSGTQSGITLGSETTEAIEQWSYNRGPTQFIRVLTFRGGRLESVEETDRGYSESD